MDTTVNFQNMFSDSEFKNVLKSKETVGKSHVEGLLNQYKEMIVKTLIQEFGLSRYFDHFKDGGNVDTIHNVRAGVYATDEERSKYQNRESYDSDKYHKDDDYIKINRNNSLLKKEGKLSDAYSGAKLSRNAKTDLDHVISAYEIDNDPGRILADVRGEKLANTEVNLKMVDQSVNRSKKAQTMNEFIEKLEQQQQERNKRLDLLNGKTDLTDKEVKEINKLEKLNAVDKEKMQSIDKEARKSYNKEINKAYYTSGKFAKSVAKTSLNQGFNMAKKQAVGIFLYEFQDAAIDEIKRYFKNYKSYKTLNEKLSQLKDAFARIQKRVISRTKDAITAFKEGFVGGLLSNIITVIINTFITTSKNMAKLLNDGFTALIKAYKLIFQPNGLSKEEAYKEAAKVLVVAVVGSVGVMLSQALFTYLSTTPFNPFAEIISSITGTILAGIISVSLIFVIDNFKGIVQEIGEAFSDIKFQVTVSAAQIKETYYKKVQQQEQIFQEILNNIYKEYEKLNKLTEMAYDFAQSAGVQFQNSQKLATAVGVSDSKILKTVDDIDDFFMN